MNLPIQAAPIIRNRHGAKTIARQDGIEASIYNVSVNRIAGGDGFFRDCDCECLQNVRSQPNLRFGGEEVTFFSGSPSPTPPPIPIIGFQRF